MSMDLQKKSLRDEKDKKNSFRSISGKIVCTLLAILMWVYVTYDENPISTGTYTNLPVTLVGITELEKRNLTILEGELLATIKVSGPRNVLGKVIKGNIGVVADVSNITAVGEQNPIITITGIPESLSVEEKKITEGKLVTDVLIKKVLPLQAELVGTMGENLVENNKKVEPEQITVKGAEKLLQNVTAWTEPIDVGTISKSENVYKTGIVLKDSLGKALTAGLILKSDSEATVTIECLSRREVPLNPPHIVGSLSGYNINITEMSPETVFITGPVEEVELIDSLDVEEIDAYYAMSSKKFLKEIILPENIKCESSVVTVSVDIISKDHVNNNGEVSSQ